MKSKSKFKFNFAAAVLSVLPLLGFNAVASPLYLGSAGNFVVLGGASITNTGSTTLVGDYGIDTGTSIAENGVTVNGVSASLSPNVVVDGAVGVQAQADLSAAIVSLNGLTPNYLLGDVYETGNEVLTPGVYSAPSSFDVNGTLFLNFENEPNASFVFQVDSALFVEGNVILENVGTNDSLFWTVGSSATIGTNASMEGNVLAYSNITLDTGATIECGRALASVASTFVTMDANTVSDTCTGAATNSASDSYNLRGSNGLAGGVTATPEPSSWGFLGLAMSAMVIAFQRKRAR
jgi:hypothetical protein